MRDYKKKKREKKRKKRNDTVSIEYSNETKPLKSKCH